VELSTFREYLCENILQSFPTQEATYDAVLSRAGTIADMFSDTEQLTPKAITDCITALLTTVVESPVLSCKDQAPKSIMNALSNVLEVQSRFPVQLLTGVFDTIAVLGACQRDKLACFMTLIVAAC
jgi:hypothetical protein